MSDFKYCLFILLLLVLIFGGAYLISVSDLPEWFKFFILK